MKAKRRKTTVLIVAEFVALMHARERGETAKIAEARAALKRLGVIVRFARKGGEA